uniref:Uncharacterized protein n=1 Tax=Anguilla anguilla TaxID=7936 RepID=A0A0E9SG46_ANGAN
MRKTYILPMYSKSLRYIVKSQE